MNNYQLAVAPMMDWTDRHCRYFLRCLSPHILLYTEMITAHAIVRGDRDYLLNFDSSEHPVALQLGGSDPELLAQAAHIAQEYGYDEINLNVGCPSNRVQAGRFGVCLMKEPELVGGCVSAIKSNCDLPVTVKTRIGVDHNEGYDFTKALIDHVVVAGCDGVSIHARKAWLHGLSPKENRTLPPLNYQVAYDLKSTFPRLPMMINGGIESVHQVQQHLSLMDGVMLGRAAYHNPYLLMEVGCLLWGQQKYSREQVIHRLLPYVEDQLSQGVKLSMITRHLLGLFHGEKNARVWRRCLTENAREKNADCRVLIDALESVKCG